MVNVGNTSEGVPGTDTYQPILYSTNLHVLSDGAGGSTPNYIVDPPSNAEATTVLTLDNSTRYQNTQRLQRARIEFTATDDWTIRKRNTTIDIGVMNYPFDLP